MPDVYVSQIDFGDGIVRKLKAEGGGMYIGNVTSFNAAVSAGVKKVTLTWTDPDDIVIGGVTQVEWGGTVIVRKAGSIPVSSGDGTVIVDNKVRNQYSTNGFEDTNVDFDTVYYYRAFPYTTNGQSTAGSSLTVEIETIIQIYGASWDGTSTNLWTRTDAASSFTDPIPAVNNGTGSSPFDNLMPWSGIRVVEDEEAGTLVAIPKFWYKISRNLGQLVKIQISNGPQENFLVSPAHADRGDGQGERDVVYIGRYKCGSSYKSVNGQTPVGGSNRAGFRANIHNLGSTIWQQDFAMWWTIRMLYLVEYANWDSQSAIGYGCSPVEGTVVEMGYTDSMQYHTGTTAANRTTYGGTQYRHIEGLWDNRYEWYDGIYFSGSSIYCIKNPANFSDSSGGTSVGTRSTDSGIISGWTKPSASGFEYALFPSAVIASGTTYVSDKYNYNSSGAVLYGGGSSYGERSSGAFCLTGTNTASETVGYVSSRLMKLPNNS